MKNLKKLLTVFFFTVAVSLFAFAISASAEEITYALDDGEIYFDTDTGTITGGENTIKVLDIPEDIEGITVTAIAENAFKDMSATTNKEIKLRTVKIPATIETIGTGAFAGCKYLEEFTVSKNNKYFSDIDGVLCNYDGSVLISYPNAKEGLDGNGIYYIPESIIEIAPYAFTATHLYELYCPNVVSLASRAFVDIYIHRIVARSALNNYSYNSFYNEPESPWNSNKLYLYVEDFRAWEAATYYIYAVIDDYARYAKTPYPVEGGNIYYDKYSYEIMGCDTSMKVVDIPAEINGVEITTIRNWAFDEQYYLQSVNIPAGVKELSGFAFHECKNLKSITVDDANPYFCDVDGVLFNSDITEIIAYPSGYPVDSYTLPKTVTRINGGAFIHVILDTLDISSVTKLAESAFVNFYIQNMYANADLTEYYVNRGSFKENHDYYRSTKVYNVYFRGDSIGPWKDLLKSFGEKYICNFEGKIESYPLGGGKIYYNSLTGTITGASGVRNLDIPEEINGTKIVAIADNAFAPYVGYQQETEYYSFNRVTIPGSVEEIGKYTFYCVDIDELIICDGVKIIGDNAFEAAYGNNRLKSLTIPDSVTYIGKYAFEYNNGLTSLTIPGSVKTIAYGAFSECQRLNTLILEDGIEIIGDYAFNCCKISELYIPQSVKTVGDASFELCDKLQSLTYYSTTDVDENAFDDCTSLQNINVIRVEELDPDIITEGLAITVRNLNGVKDFFIAKGTYNTYRELKPHNIMRIPEAKINGANEYTYTVNQPGEYTVCVRFNDGSENLILYATATAELPELATMDLALTVYGLKDIRVIRTAPGVWNSPAEVKRAAGCRNITANTIGNTDSYTVYYPESGTYTVTLEYTNGLVVVEHIELNSTIPTLVQDGNSVVIGNLDNLYTIRYAKGEYATMGEIKRAEGCQIRRSRDIKNGVITVNDLEAGTYTFCVQYNDQSYNYFTVVVK